MKKIKRFYNCQKNSILQVGNYFEFLQSFGIQITIPLEDWTTLQIPHSWSWTIEKVVFYQL